MATIKKSSKRTLAPKSSSVSSRMGSYGKKMKSGGALGMKSVKAGFDKNPGVTRADIIVAGKGQAKKGMKVKKAQDGFRATNKQRTKGSEPLTEYYPKINRGSGNLIPVGATKNPKTGKPLRPAKQKMGGKTKKCMTGCK